MDEAFKKWLCKLTDIDFESYDYITKPTPWRMHELEILIKAMWAINRVGVCKILMNYEYCEVSGLVYQCYWYCNSHDSEQEALTKSLKYVWKQTIKESE